MFNAHQFNYVPHRPAIVVPALPRIGTDSFAAMREGQQTLQGVIDEFKNGGYTADTAREVIRQYTRALLSNFRTGQSWQDAIAPWIDAVDDHAQRINNAGREGATRTSAAGATANGGPPPIPHQSRPQTFPPGTNQPGGATQVTPRQWRDIVGLPDSNPRPSVAPVQTQSNVTAAGQRRSRAGSPADEDEETDEDDTSKRPHKRQKQDESTFGWAADAFIQQSLLSAKHLSIRSQIENYELDLDTAINNLLRSGCNPIFPKKQWRAVLQDQYINLSEVFAHISALHKSDSTPTSSSKLAEALELTTLVKRAPSKDVADQNSWRQAWRPTIDAIIFAFPDRYKEVVKYEQHILQLFDDHIPEIHPNILQYDVAVRQLIGTRSDLLYEDFEHAACRRLKSLYLATTGVLFAAGKKGSGSNQSVRSKNKAGQVVTTGMPTKEESSSGSWDESSKRRYVDWRACFGNSGSPRAWASVMGLVVWIAIFVLHIIFLGCYVDDVFGVAEEGDTEVYEPYATSMPTDQARFLRLLDYLGLSHRRAKQLSGEILTVIGFLLDPNRLTATLPSESKDELVRQVRSFANSRRRTLHEWQQMAGWMNWSFNVYPLMRPALSNVYEKMSGKSNPSAQIFVNKAVTTDLLWFAEHVERSSGMFFFANLDWDPSTESDLIIYGDACLDGLGFWVPSCNAGFSGNTDPASEMGPIIFYWEALTVLSALTWVSAQPSYTVLILSPSSTPCPPDPNTIPSSQHQSTSSHNITSTYG
ncbi:hypothetical protein D9757_012570 [Collybiopsis confluens]|uniref:Uncharacterized protein n=1 Tax=Collybiopsis confluens TaxID=2823264 RepID=A0A8H5G1C8_9AGAR|nr:hypothetical protein D9757_012570 [Collybiopsis confluens]